MDRFFYDTGEAPAENALNVLVIYDITDNKRRYRFNKFLESYGMRVQRSAFEGRLTKRNYEKLCSSVPAFIDKDEDNVRIYVINTAYNVVAWGDAPAEDADDVVII